MSYVSYVTFAQFLLLGRYAPKINTSILVLTGPYTKENILPLTAKPLPAVLGSLVANHL
jgi:hypothetical protein